MKMKQNKKLQNKTKQKLEYFNLSGAILASPTTPKMKTLMLESFCKPEIFTGIAAMFSKRDYYTIDGE